MHVVNPTTGEEGPEFALHTRDEVEAKLKLAVGSQAQWAETPLDHRAELLRRVAESLRARKRPLAELMTREMGKPLAQGVSEAEKCAWVCDYYAEHAAGFLAREVIETDASESFVSHQPYGLVLAIMPWNFPFWQLFRHAAPGLMAGNAILLKHAANVPGCAEAIEQIFVDAGYLHGLVTNLRMDHDVAEEVIEDPRVAGVTLTGSTQAGQAIAAIAGRALKKTVLELGGSDPYVILDDADLDAAVEASVHSRLINNGQSCIAAKRFLVTEKNHDAFVTRMVALMKDKTMGDPMDEGTDIGPQAREDLRDDLHAQVKKSVEAGAKCELGGEVPDRPGFFYPPTVLTGVKKGMPAFDEELFGPVAAVIRCRDEEEAIALANDTPFGLGAAVFTADVARGRKIAETRLHAGCCFVNAFVKSDPRLPFGGVGQSGYGRELARQGILEFVNAKTVYVA
ncbi:MAG: NAD-dependent succinate-semialdehyde dehydrogenase [Sandaracinaceae bacterium]